MKKLLKKISFLCFLTLPWHECEMGFIGLALLRNGNEYRFTLGFLFVEVGFRIGDDGYDDWRMDKIPDIGFEVCGNCSTSREIIGNIVEKCPFCGDDGYELCANCGLSLKEYPALFPNQECPPIKTTQRS